MAPAAVTFDYWNTLIRETGSGARERRIDAWLGLLEGEGLALEREHLHAAFDSGWSVFQQHWRENVMFGAVEAVDHVLSALGQHVPDGVRDDLVSVVTDPSPEHDPVPTEHVAECLAALADAGVRIGIICDVGLTPSRTLRRFLDRHGLLDRFDHWSFSDEVGVFKPDPMIFRHALDGLGIENPASAAHVGDLRRTDVAGAQALGITSVRYTGVYDDPGGDPPEVEADHVIADHAELAGALGFG